LNQHMDDPITVAEKKNGASQPSREEGTEKTILQDSGSQQWHQDHPTEPRDLDAGEDYDVQ